MSNYYIADLHLFHSNVLKNGKFHEREFETLDEMHNTIIHNWNKVVKPDDTVYIVGDISLKKDTSKAIEIISKLNGHKILIKGNHDNTKNQNIKKLLDGIYDYLEITDEVKGKPITVVMCHYPLFSWKNQFRGAVHLYGHVHDNEDDRMYQRGLNVADRYFSERDKDEHCTFNAINVGCMLSYMNYTPRTLEELLDMKKTGRI